MYGCLKTQLEHTVDHVMLSGFKEQSIKDNQHMLHCVMLSVCSESELFSSSEIRYNVLPMSGWMFLAKLCYVRSVLFLNFKDVPITYVIRGGGSVLRTSEMLNQLIGSLLS